MLLVICIILCCNFTVAERIQTDINDWVLDYTEIFENSKQNCEIKNIIPIYDLNNNIVCDILLVETEVSDKDSAASKVSL